MKKTLIALTIVCFVFIATSARAEYNAWAPINPSFIGGNPFAGQYLLDKAKSTNEYQSDPTKKIDSMMNKMMDRLEDMTTGITDSINNMTGNIENMNINFDLSNIINNIIQAGSNNSAVLTGGGMLGGFNPNLGME